MKKIKHGGNIDEVAKKLNVPKEEILDFSANINPLGLPESFKRMLIENIDAIKHYPDPEYNQLREDIKEFYGMEKEHVIVGNGATEVIFSIISNLSPKKSMILAPTFLEYERALRKVNSQVEYFKLKETNNFKVDSSMLDRIHEDLDLLILCNPNNPTSQLIKREMMIQILNRCEEKNVHLIIDEAFMEFYDEEEKESMIQWVKKSTHLSIIKALTKYFALPGLRIGYGFTSNERLLMDIQKTKQPWSVNGYAAMAGVVFQDDNYIQKSKEWIVKEQKYLFDAFNKIEEIKPYKPFANYMLFQLKRDCDLKKALLSKKIMIRSCDNYENLDKCYYRIAIKDGPSNERLVQALKEVLYED